MHTTCTVHCISLEYETARDVCVSMRVDYGHNCQHSHVVCILMSIPSLHEVMPCLTRLDGCFQRFEKTKLIRSSFLEAVRYAVLEFDTRKGPRCVLCSDYGHCYQHLLLTEHRIVPSPHPPPRQQ